MSELAVGSLKGLAANSFVIDIAAGSTLNVPPPAILQVVSVTKTDIFDASVAAGAVSGDVTGLTATITPSSTSSKIFVTYSLHVGQSESDRRVGVVLFRNGSALSGAVGTAAGSRTSVTSATETRAISMRTSANMFLDSPATESAVTYSFRIFNGDATTSTVYVNRAATDTDGNQFYRAVSTITVMEVAG